MKRTPDDTTERTLSGTLAGLTGASSLGLVGLGAAGLLVIALGFWCAGSVDGTSGRSGGSEFGVLSLTWTIVAAYACPLAAGLCLFGLVGMLLTTGFGWFAFRSRPEGS